MPGPLVAGIAGSIGSAAIGASSANKAAKAQSAAADAQIEETRRQFDLVQSLLKPYVSAGTAGLQAQLDLMGLGGSAGTAPEIDEIFAPGQPVAGGTNLGIGRFQGRGERFGMGEGRDGHKGWAPSVAAQVTPTPTGFQVGDRTFTTRAEAEAFANTQRTGAVSAEEAQRRAIAGIEGGAQFGELVRQGEYGILANQSATGGLRGGDTMGAMAQFRPAMLQALIDKQLANYGGLAANGQNAAAMTGTAAQNAGAQVNQALGQIGQAQAGGALASGQAWANAGSGILNTIGMMAQPITPGGGAWQQWRF